MLLRRSKQRIKDAIKASFLYGLIEKRRLSNPLRTWTEHDDRMLAFYSEFIKPGDLCFDIGANIGTRTRIFSRIGARVIAVEPQDICMVVLRKFFRRDRSVILVQKALGSRESVAEMYLSNAHTLSSLSEDWISKVKNSGRFREFTWDRKQTVEMTTLDRLIAEYGVPAFIKIDVEGFELEVIRGLSTPVGVLSLEFTPESRESIEACIRHLSTMGNVRLNYSFGESLSLELDEWVSEDKMSGLLNDYANIAGHFGDVYIRFMS